MTTTLDHPLRLSRKTWKAGSGRGCAMNVISWEQGEDPITDHPVGVDPLLARLVTRVNDTHCDVALRDNDYLCARCSSKVLALAHRTVGTALDEDAWPFSRRMHLYGDIARAELQEVSHIRVHGPLHAMSHVNSLLSEIPSPYKREELEQQIMSAAAVVIDGIGEAMHAVLPEAVRQHALYSTVTSVIDRFEALTGVKARPVAPETTIEAIHKMRVREPAPIGA